MNHTLFFNQRMCWCHISSETYLKKAASETYLQCSLHAALLCTHPTQVQQHRVATPNSTSQPSIRYSQFNTGLEELMNKQLPLMRSYITRDTLLTTGRNNLIKSPVSNGHFFLKVGAGMMFDYIFFSSRFQCKVH